MKRTAAFLLTLLLLMLAVSSLAAPDTPYAAATVLGWELLSPTQQSLAELIYRTATDHRTEVSFPAGTRYEDADTAVRWVVSSYPELIALDREWSITYFQNRPSIAAGLRLSYQMDREEAEAEWQQIMAKVGRMFKGIGGDAFDTELLLHDRLCETVAYSDTGARAHSVTGALLDGRAVCDGYAGAFCLLMRMVGIPCGIVEGEAEDASGGGPHSWNIVRLDGDVYQIDVTWDDQLWGYTHFYFNRNAEDFAKTHTISETCILPELTAKDDMEYHRRRILAWTQDACEEAFISCVRMAMRGDNVVEMRVTDGSPSYIVENSDRWLNEYNEAYLDKRFYGSYSVVTAEDTGCFRMMMTPK